jgi:hypothetical protein
MDPSPKTGDSAGPPFLTVLLLTWRRTKYLQQAIESVLHQTLERTQYEIILSKGVADPALEEYCRSHGVNVLFEESWDFGRRIHLALEHCRGEVIVPLEDDDEFEPNKLAILSEEFHRHPDLVYFHNGFQLIGEDSQPRADVKFRSRARRLLATSGSVYSATGPPTERLVALENLDPSWNSSALAFRKRLLDGRGGEILGRLAFLASRWIYLCALMSRKGVLIDQRPLTRYRIHPANSSGVGGRRSPQGGEVRELVERVRSISDRQLADFELLRTALLEASEPGLAETVEDRLPLLRFLSALRDPQPRRKRILARFLELLRRGGRGASSSPWAGRWTSTFVLYGLTPLFVLSPRWGSQAYVHLREAPRM